MNVLWLLFFGDTIIYDKMHNSILLSPYHYLLVDVVIPFLEPLCYIFVTVVFWSKQSQQESGYTIAAPPLVLFRLIKKFITWIICCCSVWTCPDEPTAPLPFQNELHLRQIQNIVMSLITSKCIVVRTLKQSPTESLWQWVTITNPNLELSEFCLLFHLLSVSNCQTNLHVSI